MQLKLARDYFDNPIPPEVYLCATDKQIIGKLDCYDLKGTFKWNTYSEVSFTVDRIYTDVLTGEAIVNPLFDKIESPRMVYLKDIGYFILQDSDTTYSDKDSKSVTAFSLEYSCANKYLENFRVNTGEVDSVEVTYYVSQLGTEDYYNEDKKYKLATKWDEYEMYYFKNYTDNDSYEWTRVQVEDEEAYKTYDGSTVEKTLYVKNYPNVRFYWPSHPELSLVDLILKKIPGWTVDEVDSTLWHKERKFDEDRIDVYSFLMNEVTDVFKCVVFWNTLNNTISFYEEAEDGINEDNTLQTRWDTDVYISRDNLANEINIKMSADNIKTKLKVSGADNLDIREVNLGKNHIMNLSYYHTEEWMGKELYDKYSKYLTAVEEAATPYSEASKKRVAAYNKWNDLMNAVPVEGNVLLIGDEFKKLYCTYTPINTAYLHTQLSDYHKDKTFGILYADEACTIEIDKNNCESTYVVQGYEFVYQEGQNNFLCKYFLNLDEFPKRLGIYGVNKDTTAEVSNNVLLTLKNNDGDSVTIRVYNASTAEKPEKNPDYKIKVKFVPGNHDNPIEEKDYDWQDWIRGKMTVEYFSLNGKNLVIASIGTLGAYLCLAKDERLEENLEDYGVRLLQEREATYQKIFQTQLENMFSNGGHYCVAGSEEPTASVGELVDGSKWFDTSGDTVVLKEYNSQSDPHWQEVDLTGADVTDSDYHNYQRYIDNYNKLLSVKNVLARKQMEADYWLNGYKLSRCSIGANIEPFFQGAAKIHFGDEVQRLSFDKTIPLYTFKYSDNTFVMYLKGTTPYIAYADSQYMCQKQMNDINKATDFETFFNEEQWIKLSPFIREDEYSDDNFLLTGYESEEERLNICKELQESAAKELKTLSQPSWEFSMNMANILALPEFEPIMHQFALGNFVRIYVRDGYVKRARLLEVQLSFDDLSDFNCTFGNLVTTKSEIDKHADLLAQAISAGKQVATAAGDWQRAFDTSTKLENDIDSGLQDITLEIGKANGQNIEIGQYGIWGKRLNDDGTEWDPVQFRIVNNRMVYTKDNFETTEAVFGEFKYKGETYYGIKAKAVVGGLIDGTKIYGGEIDGTKIFGGEINIGDGNFAVDGEGNVTMKVANIEQYVKSEDVQAQVEDAVNNAIKNRPMYRVEVLITGSTVFNNTDQETKLSCQAYNWSENINYNINEANCTWSRCSGDDDADGKWNKDRIGKFLTLKHDDVKNGASFTCTVITSDGQSITSNPIVFIDMTDINVEKDDVSSNLVYTESPNVYVDDDGSLCKVASPTNANAGIYDLASDDLNPYKILDIPVKEYRYYASSAQSRIGLINDDVAEKYPIAAGTEAWDVRTIVAAMLKIIQDQQEAIDELKQKVEELSNETI